jgi:hypothetical protein
MTDNELETLYKQRLGLSQLDALRDVFEAGYNLASGTTPALTSNPSPAKVATLASVVAKLPIHVNK